MYSVVTVGTLQSFQTYCHTWSCVLSEDGTIAPKRGITAHTKGGNIRTMGQAVLYRTACSLLQSGLHERQLHERGGTITQQ